MPTVICGGEHAAFWPRTAPLQLTWELQLCYWAEGGCSEMRKGGRGRGVERAEEAENGKPTNGEG